MTGRHHRVLVTRTVEKKTSSYNTALRSTYSHLIAGTPPTPGAYPTTSNC